MKLSKLYLRSAGDGAKGKFDLRGLIFVAVGQGPNATLPL